MSINAQELRIGNWVDLNGENTNVGYGYIGDLYQKQKGIRNSYLDALPLVSGITLTPEILLACGFTKFIDMEVSKKEKKDIYMYFLKTDYVQITFVFGVTVLIGNDGFGKQAQCDISGRVKYLHQLQNLYFALTQKELEYSPIKK